MDRKCQKLALILFALNCELPFEFISVRQPLLNVKVIFLHEATDDAGDAKVVASVQLNVHEIIVSRQDVADVALLEEVNAVDVVTFEKDVLIPQLDQWLQQRAYPGDEGDGSILEELKLLECALEYEECHFKSKVLRQGRNKLNHILNIVLILVFY